MKIAGRNALKTVIAALCRMKRLLLDTECIKILGVYILDNKKLQEEKKFLLVCKQLPMDVKITTLKLLVTFKRLYLVLLTFIQNNGET